MLQYSSFGSNRRSAPLLQLFAMQSSKLRMLKRPTIFIRQKPVREQYPRFVKSVLRYNWGRKDLMVQKVVNSVWTHTVKQGITGKKRHWTQQVRQEKDPTYHSPILTISPIEGSPCPLQVCGTLGQQNRETEKT